MHFQFYNVTIEHSANILSFSIMRSVSLRWNFQHTAYLSAVFILLEDALTAEGHRVYFRSLYIAHRDTQSGLRFCSFSLLSAVKCWTFVPIRMNISPGMRVAARRHESFPRYHRRALLQNATRARRPCKKVPLGVYSTSRVAANGRCYTGRDTVTGELRGEKQVATGSFFTPGYSTHPPTQSKSLTLYSRNFITKSLLI